MRRALGLFALAVLAVSGVFAGVFVSGSGAKAKPKLKKATITVKASEFKFALSKRKVAAGTIVTFKVVNAGKISHDFKINGKKTPTLGPGKSARLKVTFTKKGHFAYLCTLPGHAGAGMKGVFSVGSAPVPARKSTIKKTTITVKASEFKFALSKRSVKAGSTVVFKVTNTGKLSHDFKINGKKTPTLSPGKSATLKVTFKKKGHYAYICTILGHVKLGMKGVFSVGAAPVPVPKPTTTATTATTATTSTTTTTTTTGTVGSANTTVTVDMFEYRFELSQPSMPSGQVTFVINNKGQEVHNFNLTGVKVGALLAPGKSETWTVGLPAGTFGYVCDVPFHIDRGMTGSLTVTP